MRAALSLYAAGVGTPPRADAANDDGGPDASPRATPIYALVNAALRSADAGAMVPWRDFVWLVLHAWKKLRPEPETTLYRGMPFALLL